MESLKPYRWYWRLEPGVQYTCAITYDPFLQMARHNKAYGFTTALWELGTTCPSLFRAVDDFRSENKLPRTSMWNALFDPAWEPWPIRWMMGLLRVDHRDSRGYKWNLCHYWSNFEIADLDFFRGNMYQKLFKHLDHQGGFYDERVSNGQRRRFCCSSLTIAMSYQWGDAPVHSLAVHLLLPPERVHHFSDFGYLHDPFFQCPGNAPGGQLTNNTALGSSSWSTERPEGIGCRCDCASDQRRNNRAICLSALQEPMALHRPSYLQRYRGEYPYALNIP
jgi:mannosyltransferase